MAAPEKNPQEALARLQPLQPILAGFAHRNKNQHRGARWWAAFSMLRRHMDKLVQEVETAVADARKKPAKKRKRGDAAGAGTGGGDVVGGGEASRAEVRARWLLGVLLPKTYIAFSQLTADNQFATLGVVLLAVLAQVDTACGHLVERHGATVTTTADAPEAAAAAPAEVVADRFPEAKDDAVDVGQAVSREEVAQATASSSSSWEKTAGAAGPDVAGPKPKRRKPHALIDGDGDDEAGPAVRRRTTAAPAATKVTREDKKKQKKAKKGDEFDELFKSLV